MLIGFICLLVIIFCVHAYLNYSVRPRTTRHRLSPFVNTPVTPWELFVRVDVSLTVNSERGKSRLARAVVREGITVPTAWGTGALEEKGGQKTQRGHRFSVTRGLPSGPAGTPRLPELVASAVKALPGRSVM